MDGINLKALAKINLSLDVVRKREDGYHEVRMIMQTINLYDKLEIRKSDEKGIHVTTNISFLPTNENNLVYKAAKLLIEEFGIEEGVSIHLYKYIPVAAGMAGGSSDAAAVLYGMNKLFNLKLSKQDLMERGVKLGADVPYCIMRGTALAEGIGEKLTKLPPAPECFVIIAKPGISVSTKFVYENLHANELTYHPDIDGMIEEIKQGSLEGVAEKMGNVLETVTIKEYPVIEKIKDTMKENGAINAMMSGSGPTVFGLFKTEEEAKKAYAVLEKDKDVKKLYITTMFNNK
ncbi:MAG: 4-(cytidine 5'-diphospho)-2-C-methyl-D-erythritol kinase [Lachnospiraceae bacterium]|nr:4-(cytidine 5'-diphospho)-2-C-methyl-D-erythritol kinase [Lachnospiraceae bacterium]